MTTIEVNSDPCRVLAVHFRQLTLIAQRVSTLLCKFRFYDDAKLAQQHKIALVHVYSENLSRKFNGDDFVVFDTWLDRQDPL